MTDMIKHYRQLVGIAKSWALKALPGWSEESHQDLLVRAGARRVEGRVSASTLNLTQLGAALADYESRGWPRRPFFADRQAGKSAKPRVVSPQIGHLFRLWGRLAKAGLIKDGGRPALLAWCGRQTGRTLANLDAMTPDELNKAVEAVKAWAARG